MGAREEVVSCFEKSIGRTACILVWTRVLFEPLESICSVLKLNGANFADAAPS